MKQMMLWTNQNTQRGHLKIEMTLQMNSQHFGCLGFQSLLHHLFPLFFFFILLFVVFMSDQENKNQDKERNVFVLGDCVDWTVFCFTR